jgi:hypothetical protein
VIKTEARLHEQDVENKQAANISSEPAQQRKYQPVPTGREMKRKKS